MPSMSTELRSLLVDNDVHQDIINWLGDAAQQCYSIKSFANWVDERSDIDKYVVQCVPSQKTSRSQIAAVKQAWREAEGIVSRGLKRSAEGLSEEALDEPLHSDLQRSLEATFEAYYKFTIEPRRFGYDALLGRFRREFDRRQPSALALTRARSLADSQRTNIVKRRQLAFDVQVEFGNSYGDEASDMNRSSSQCLRHLFHALEIFSNTWALAGCFDVEWLQKSGTMIKYVHWQDACFYVQSLKDKADGYVDRGYTQASIYDSLITLETAFRARAIELSRARDPMPWGLALRQALKDESSKWQDDKDKLVKMGEKPGSGGGGRGGPGGGDGRREAARGGPSPAALKNGGVGDRSQGGGDKSTRNNRNAHTVSEQNGKRVCKAFNDQRGCKHPCEKGLLHVCDIRLQGGRVCGKSHNRRSHDEKRDGKITRG
jgi:hypothetical protein